MRNLNHPYHVECMVRTNQSVWKFVWSSKYANDAIGEAVFQNSMWLEGEAIHRVVENKTGVVIFEKGSLRKEKR